MTTAQDIMSTDYISIDINKTISELIGAFKKQKQHYALVFDGKKYLGTIAKRFLLTSRIDPAKMKIHNIIKKRSKSKTPFFVPTLQLDTDIKKICKLMATSDSHLLPVIEKDKVLGVVHSYDVVKEIADEYSKMNCEEFSRTPITIRPEDGIDTALNVLSREGIDHLPIVDAQNRLMGMVSMTDLINMPNLWSISSQKISQAASHQGGKHTGYSHGEKTKMSNLPIKNCMSTKKICCTPPETKVPAAIKIMEENGVCNIILVKYDKPVGIMTIKDILVDYAK